MLSELPLYIDAGVDHEEGLLRTGAGKCALRTRSIPLRVKLELLTSPRAAAGKSAAGPG